MSGTRRDGERDGLLDMVVGGVVSVRVGRGLGGLIVEIRERSSPLLCLLENCDCQDSSSGCVSCLCIERDRWRQEEQKTLKQWKILHDT